ncbi:porin [Limnohabitans radicicola]|uniref:Porin n=1 Tax=Limnohabitans radicicola TaxID=2771427 RepID=A0A927FG27_9BURK|nr:porin [Limnohabitans radicicola]MBD8050386.1 porin [Limnohabitans radicicola]
MKTSSALNKIACAAAIVCFTSLSHGQSAVGIYGVADLGVRHTSGMDASNAPATANANAMGSGIDTTSRLGYRGTEDLGGGLKAEFNFETGLNVDTGTPANAKFFDRASVVGLSGAWGTALGGRQTTLLADAVGVVDPLGNRYASFNPNIQIAALSGHKLGQEYGSAGSSSGSYRLDNAIKYIGKFGNFSGRAMYGFGEQNGSNAKLSSTGASLAYEDARFAATLAYSQFKSIANLDLKAYFGGVSAKLGDSKLNLSYGQHEAQTSLVAKTENKTLGLGVNHPLSDSLSLIATYYKVDRSRTGLTADGFNRMVTFAEYKLSKRSLVYAELDSTKWKNNYQGTGNASTGKGFSMGVKHTF